MGCAASAPDKGAAGGIEEAHRGHSQQELDEAREAANLVTGNQDFSSPIELSISCRNLPQMDVSAGCTS